MGIVEVAGIEFLLLFALVCVRVIMQKIDEGRLDAGCFALFVIFVLLPIGLVFLVLVLVFLVTGNEEGTIMGSVLNLVARCCPHLHRRQAQCGYDYRWHRAGHYRGGTDCYSQLAVDARSRPQRADKRN